MKIRLGRLRSLLREAAYDSIAGWLKPGDVVAFRNNRGIVSGCTVVSTDEYAGKVTIDIPFGPEHVRVTIDADQIADVETA